MVAAVVLPFATTERLAIEVDLLVEHLVDPSVVSIVVVVVEAVADPLVGREADP